MWGLSRRVLNLRVADSLFPRQGRLFYATSATAPSGGPVRPGQQPGGAGRGKGRRKNKFPFVTWVPWCSSISAWRHSV